MRSTIPELVDSRTANETDSKPLPFFHAAALPWVAGSVLFFGVACGMPAIEAMHRDGDHFAWSGFHALTRGWLGFVDGQLAWYANPPLAMGWLYLMWWRPRAALLCGLLALALSFHTHRGFTVPQIGDELFYQRPLAGYYFWMGSIILLTLGGAVGSLTQRKPTNSPNIRQHVIPTD